MKSQKEIDEQITRLKEIKPKVRPYSAFGTDNLAQLDAQVTVLEKNLDNDEIYDRYDRAGLDEETLMGALEARNWLNGESEYDDLAEDWPLIK